MQFLNYDFIYKGKKAVQAYLALHETKYTAKNVFLT